MNVIIANKYKEMLDSLDIDVIKSMDGEFTVDEIVERFSNFFFQRMILDITALKNYKDDQKTKFSTYAYFYIIGEIKKYIRESKLIKISK